jgi:hypothetical protein
MQRIIHIAAAFLLSAGTVLSAAQNLSGDEARAVAVAVEAFSHDPSWKHFHHYRVHVQIKGRLVRIEFEPAPARMDTVQGRRHDTLVIQTFGRSAEFVVEPSTGQIVSRSYSRD